MPIRRIVAQDASGTLEPVRIAYLSAPMALAVARQARRVKRATSEIVAAREDTVRSP